MIFTNRIAIAVLASAPSLAAQATTPDLTGDHIAKVQQQLDDSNTELRELIEKLKDEKIPLSRSLSDLQGELITLRKDYQNVSRKLARRKLDLAGIRSEIKRKDEHATHVSTVLSEFGRNYRSRLHIAELPRYAEKLDEADLAPSNTNLSGLEIFERQATVLDVALEQLGEALGGSSFTGKAVTEDGLVREGTFTMMGPAAIFLSNSDEFVGIAEQRLGSLEPTQFPFADPRDQAAARGLAGQRRGEFPLDPTLGNALKIEATEESFAEHVAAGGLVMVPIFGMAGLAFLVALFKFCSFLFVRVPSRKKLEGLLACVKSHDVDGATQQAAKLSGPIGSMLQAGVEHIEEPRELVEEVMYESVLKARLKLNSLLPFIAICASSAPLLGLLGTVTGIINTFKLLTVFGSGDVSNLSGGISEALITTKFGLIVAIPSLLIHAFLSRKARGVLAQMESAAVAFANAVGLSPFEREHFQPSSEGAPVIVPSEPDEELVRNQVRDVLTGMLSSSDKSVADKPESSTQLR